LPPTSSRRDARHTSLRFLRNGRAVLAGETGAGGGRAADAAAGRATAAREEEPATIIQFVGETIRVTFFAVAEEDDYLRNDWRGTHVRGPKKRSSFTFSDDISFNDINIISDVQQLARDVLKKRLNLNVSDLVGNRVKMTDVGATQLVNAGQFQYIELTAPAQKSYEEGTKCTKHLQERESTLFFPPE
jgi:hypothetical protein